MNDKRFFPATTMPDKVWWHTLWPEPEAVLRAVGIGPDMQVIDLCCGDGYFTRPMCELVHAGEVWALDLNPVLLDQAEKVCAQYPNFRSILGDARELAANFSTAVDFVFIANTFHGVPDQIALSKAVHDVLKEGGSFAIVNWYRRPREETTVLDLPRGPDTELRMDPEDVRAIVEPTGFELEKVVDLGPYHYGAVFVKAIGS